MGDDIRALSAALASDPSSLRYVELAELLRRRGQTPDALLVAMHGLGRHPDHADGYDVLARIHTDRNELAEARAAWERALALDADHTGALKGIGFLYFRQGDTFRAQDALEKAVAADPGDESAVRALAMIKSGAEKTGAGGQGGRGAEKAGAGGQGGRGAEGPAPKTSEQVPQLRSTASVLRPPPEPRPTRAVEPPPLTPEEAARLAAKGAIPDPRAPVAPVPPLPPVFEGFEGATNDILLLDARGLVMAGGLRGEAGEDVSELAAAALAGVSGEASRTAGYLSLGIWNVIVAEAETANVVLSPVGDGALLMARRDRSTPVGLAIRIAERARGAAARWLAGHGG